MFRYMRIESWEERMEGCDVEGSRVAEVGNLKTLGHSFPHAIPRPTKLDDHTLFGLCLWCS